MVIPQWSEESSITEEDIDCSRKSHIETVNEEMKGGSSEEEETGIRKCRIRSRVDIINEEVKRRTCSLKQQKVPP